MAKKRKDRVLLLETQLDRPLTSQRGQTRFMREFFQNLPSLELIAKEVHSRSDLKKFLDLARKDRSIHTVHIIAHGRKHRSKTSIVLTNDESINLRDPGERVLFRNLGVEVIFFSCCQLGGDVGLMGRILETSGANAVFSYTDDVTDYQAFIIEPLFYHLAYGYCRGRPSRVDLQEVYERMKFSLEYLGIDESREALITPLLAADFAP